MTLKLSLAFSHNSLQTTVHSRYIFKTSCTASLSANADVLLRSALTSLTNIRIPPTMRDASSSLGYMLGHFQESVVFMVIIKPRLLCYKTVLKENKEDDRLKKNTEQQSSCVSIDAQAYSCRDNYPWVAHANRLHRCSQSPCTTTEGDDGNTTKTAVYKMVLVVGFLYAPWGAGRKIFQATNHHTSTPIESIATLLVSPVPRPA